MYLQDLSLIFDELDRRIKSARKSGNSSITIKYRMTMGPHALVGKNGERTLQSARTSQSELYKYFSQGDSKDVVITDFDAALVQLKTKLDAELAESLDIIDKAENRDPNNALYNYLKAHIYFKLGYNGHGLNQINISAQKEYLKTYYAEINQSVSKVLELIDFPKPLRQYIKVSYSPAAQFIRESILTKDLEPLIVEYRTQDKKGKISEILDIVALIKEQVLREPMPYDTLPQRYSEIIDKWIENQKSKLSIDSSK